MCKLRLEVMETDGTYIDYAIMVGKDKVGILLVVDNKESIFGRQIHIYDEYKCKGYATMAMDALIEQSGKDVGICISRHSESAIAFWNKYLKTRRNEHIRGDIYYLRCN